MSLMDSFQVNLSSVKKAIDFPSAYRHTSHKTPVFCLLHKLTAVWKLVTKEIVLWEAWLLFSKMYSSKKLRLSIFLSLFLETSFTKRGVDCFFSVFPGCGQYQKGKMQGKNLKICRERTQNLLFCSVAKEIQSSGKHEASERCWRIYTGCVGSVLSGKCLISFSSTFLPKVNLAFGTKNHRWFQSFHKIIPEQSLLQPASVQFLISIGYSGWLIHK